MNEFEQRTGRNDQCNTQLERANNITLGSAFSFPILRRGFTKIFISLGQVLGFKTRHDCDLPPNEGLVHRSVHQDRTVVPEDVSRDQQIVDCHNRGYTQKEIGRVFDLSQSRISQILTKERSKNGASL